MPNGLSVQDALETARTGDIWLFRGPSTADKAIRAATNSPVNHVALAVALDDLPPLLWHTELGHSLEDLWSGDHHRGAQLNLLSEALPTWISTYRQRAFTRQLDADITREMENGLLRTVQRLDGRPFPRTARLTGYWLAGKFRKSVAFDTIYCAELVALSYQEMGLLPRDHPANWFDPGRFWSGDRLQLTGTASLGPEVEVSLPD